MSAGFTEGKGCDLDIVPLSALMKYAIDVKGNVYGCVSERLLSGWYHVLSPVLDLEVSCTLQIDIARIFSLQSSGRPAIDEKIARVPIQAAMHGALLHKHTLHIYMYRHAPCLLDIHNDPNIMYLPLVRENKC